MIASPHALSRYMLAQDITEYIFNKKRWRPLPTKTVIELLDVAADAKTAGIRDTLKRYPELSIESWTINLTTGHITKV